MQLTHIEVDIVASALDAYASARRHAAQALPDDGEFGRRAVALDDAEIARRLAATLRPWHTEVVVTCCGQEISA